MNKYLLICGLLVFLSGCSSNTQTQVEEHFESNEPLRAIVRRMDASMNKENQKYCTDKAKEAKLETYREYERAYKDCMEPILDAAERKRDYKLIKN